MFDEMNRKRESMIRPEIRALIQRGNITLEEFRQLRGNSWEWEVIVPALTDEAFAEHFAHCLNNCSPDRRRPSPTYNDAVMGHLGEEMLRRFKRFMTQCPNARCGDAECDICHGSER